MKRFIHTLADRESSYQINEFHTGRPHNGRS